MVKSRRISLTIKLCLRQESYHFGWGIGGCASMDTTPYWKFKRSHKKNVKIEKTPIDKFLSPPSSAKNVEASKIAATTLGDNHPVRTLKAAPFPFGVVAPTVHLGPVTFSLLLLVYNVSLTTNRQGHQITSPC